MIHARRFGGIDDGFSLGDLVGTIGGVEKDAVPPGYGGLQGGNIGKVPLNHFNPPGRQGLCLLFTGIAGQTPQRVTALRKFRGGGPTLLTGDPGHQDQAFVR
jgi:hypothetical protein